MDMFEARQNLCKQVLRFLAAGYDDPGNANFEWNFEYLEECVDKAAQILAQAIAIRQLNEMVAESGTTPFIADERF